jgi:transportin-1
MALNIVTMQVAPLTLHFLGPWCNALRNIRDDYEKEQAFRGLVAVVHKTPEPAVTSFPAFASE